MHIYEVFTSYPDSKKNKSSEGREKRVKDRLRRQEQYKINR